MVFQSTGNLYIKNVPLTGLRRQLDPVQCNPFLKHAVRKLDSKIKPFLVFIRNNFIVTSTSSGKISAQPHPTLCIQFLNRGNNDKNNTFPLGKQICFTVVWGCAETLPTLFQAHSLSNRIVPERGKKVSFCVQL